ncbi:MAG: hypothetical protein ACRENI_05280 [Gemmatimonadaceae bacterium]
MTSSFPRTRAERSGFTETSSHSDVAAFLDSMQRLGAPMRVGIAGHTSAGRVIPYVIASRPLVTTPQQARRLGRAVAVRLRGIVTDPARNVFPLSRE